MIHALEAHGPHPSLGEQARAFDRFVGTWNTAFTHFAPGGAVLHRYPGRVLFGWILGGRAMQDVWIGEPTGEQTEPSLGTSIRFFDTRAAAWRVLWISPEDNVVTTVQGGIVGDRILLEGVNSDGSRRRWSFNDILPNSFAWRAERSEDGGSTWRLVAEYQMSRAAE
jgi:hypothetical protein